jgi:hypothetical protein
VIWIVVEGIKTSLTYWIPGIEFSSLIRLPWSPF